MRLLHFREGELSLTNDIYNDGDIPPYAILSHRWGDEEVIFEEMANRQGRTKAGYGKIMFCAQQAAADGLQHCWVDSCCINKSSSAELTEAINSMFRWYQNAERCYVYLADVSISDQAGIADDSGSSPDQDWQLAFRQSKWFTRGWTLQELIAPSNVEFFSREKDPLGNKHSLEVQLHETTGIPIPALRNRQLSNFSMEERFSWAAARQTGIEEDMAYCLLGIFDINMPLLYGEGKMKAMARLRKMAEHAIKGPSGALLQQTLSGIRQWLGAPDPSAIPSKALKARVQNSDHWILESDAYTNWKRKPASVLWLWGKPGSGKTVISTVVLEDLLQRCDHSLRGVCAHFYFNFINNRTEGLELMLCSLISQLSKYCVQKPACLDILLALRKRGWPQPDESLRIFMKVLQEMILEFPQVFILIEGLDECLQRSQLLSVLETMWQLPNLHLLMISRHDMEFRDLVESLSNKENAAILEIGGQHEDIRQYIRHRLSSESSFRKWASDAKLRQEVEETLVERADGLFSCAAYQLDVLAKCHNRATLRRSLTTMPRSISETYDHIFFKVTERHPTYAMRILQWLTFSARPLSAAQVAEVVAIDAARDPAFDYDEVMENPLEPLNICSTFVTISDPAVEPRMITLAHPSIRDYLYDKLRGNTCHDTMAKGCLKYLLQLPETSSYEVVQTFKLARYCAEFWMYHAREAEEHMDSTSQMAIHLFSIENPAYLTWIRLYDPDMPEMEPDFSKTMDQVAPPLYYAALLGLSNVVELLLGKGADINTTGGRHGNAVQAAMAEGHESVVKLLLDKGADVDAHSER